MNNHDISFHGFFSAQHWRNGKLVSVYETHNDTLYYGKIRLLEKVFFPNTFTSPLSWYIGLIDANTYIESLYMDRFGDYLAWTEYSGYSIDGSTNATTRIQWVPDASATIGSIQNTSLVEITAIEQGLIQGIFIASDSTFGFSNNNVIMWATAILPNAITILPGDGLKMMYRVSLDNDPSYVSDQGPP